MSGKFLLITGFGLIGDDRKKGPFRQVIFKDEKSGKTTELLVYKHERPSLWSDVEKLELGKSIFPYRGEIVHYKLLDLVILGDETPEKAYEQQKINLNIKSRIHYNEAEKMRQETKGYITDLTHQGAMEINWKTIDTQASLVKFRHYEGMGIFSWTNWYEIVT